MITPGFTTGSIPPHVCHARNQENKMYRVWIRFGWDVVKYRTFETLAQCERWLDKWYGKYRPSQIVATWIQRI